MGDKVQQVSAATMKRLQNVDGRAVYSSKVVMKDSNGSSRTMQLIHSPDASGTNDTYNGTLYVVMSGDFGGQRQGQSANKSRAMSITYAKVSDNESGYRLKYELRTAMVADELVAQAIDRSGVLDLNVGTDFTAGSNFGKVFRADQSSYFNQDNDALHGITFIAFDIDPKDSTGVISYWQNPGGNYSEKARGMNFSLEEDNGALKGCASSGAASTSFNNVNSLNAPGGGVSIRRALKEGLSLQPKGYWHPMLHANGEGLSTPAGGSTDSEGTYHSKTANGLMSGQSAVMRWYKPKVSDDELARRFFEESSGTITSRQCFKLDPASGKYVIDMDEISDEAGYELVASDADTGNKIIQPPSLSEVVKFDEPVKEE
jgi:hypothetical protein